MYAQTIVAGLLSIAALTSAAPLTARQQPVTEVLPITTSQFTISTGTINFNTPRGLVSRSPQNRGADVTTLVTFQLSQEYANNQCQIVFDLGRDSSSSVSGTAKAQLFTSLAPAQAGATGNLRDQDLGTIDVNANGRAYFEAGTGLLANDDGKFPCSDIAGYTVGREVVPVGDLDNISWAAGSGDGPKILVW